MAILDGEECEWCDRRAVETCCGESFCLTCLSEHDEEVTLEEDDPDECPDCGDELGRNFRTCESCAEENR